MAENGDLDAEMTQSGWKKLEEGIGDSVQPKNKFESQGETIQDGCQTSNDVRCRDVSSEEKREEVGCGGNENVKMDEWNHQAYRIRNESIRGTTKVGEIMEASHKTHRHRIKVGKDAEEG